LARLPEPKLAMIPSILLPVAVAAIASTINTQITIDVTEEGRNYPNHLNPTLTSTLQMKTVSLILTATFAFDMDRRAST
jgi:hypothetical protein